MPGTGSETTRSDRPHQPAIRAIEPPPTFPGRQLRVSLYQTTASPLEPPRRLCSSHNPLARVAATLPPSPRSTAASITPRPPTPADGALLLALPILIPVCLRLRRDVFGMEGPENQVCLCMAPPDARAPGSLTVPHRLRRRVGASRHGCRRWPRARASLNGPSRSKTHAGRRRRSPPCRAAKPAPRGKCPSQVRGSRHARPAAARGAYRGQDPSQIRSGSHPPCRRASYSPRWPGRRATQGPASRAARWCRWHRYAARRGPSANNKLTGLLQSKTQRPTPTTAPSSFCKTMGLGRAPASDRSTSTRVARPLVHTRSKSQVPRARTAYGHHDEDHYSDLSSGGGTAAPFLFKKPPLLDWPRASKVGEIQGTPLLLAARESSLAVRLGNLRLGDDMGGGSPTRQRQVTAPVSAHATMRLSTLPRPAASRDA